MEKYLEWLKEQLAECKVSYAYPNNNSGYYLYYEGKIDAYEDAIEELEDGLRYGLSKQETIE